MIVISNVITNVNVIFTLKWMGSGDKIVCFGCIFCHIAALIAMILEGILLWKWVFYDPSRNVLKYLRKTRIFCGEVVLARGNYKTTHFLICVKSWGSGWAGLEKTSAVPSNTTQPPRSLHPLLLDNRKKQQVLTQLIFDTHLDLSTLLLDNQTIWWTKTIRSPPFSQ